MQDAQNCIHQSAPQATNMPGKVHTSAVCSPVCVEKLHSRIVWQGSPQGVHQVHKLDAIPDEENLRTNKQPSKLATAIYPMHALFDQRLMSASKLVWPRKRAHRDVVANKVPVPMLCLELHRKAAHVTQALRRSAHIVGIIRSCPYQWKLNSSHDYYSCLA